MQPRIRQEQYSVLYSRLSPFPVKNNTHVAFYMTYCFKQTSIVSLSAFLFAGKCLWRKNRRVPSQIHFHDYHGNGKIDDGDSGIF